MAKEPKNPKPSRLTMAPLYLAAGLSVCYLVLIYMVPAMTGLEDRKGHEPLHDSVDLHGITLVLSAWVRAHRSVTISGFAVVGVAGFLLPLLIRPARYLVWLVALAVFLLDVALAGGGYLHALSGLVKEANKLSR